MCPHNADKRCSCSPAYLVLLFLWLSYPKVRARSWGAISCCLADGARCPAGTMFVSLPSLWQPRPGVNGPCLVCPAPGLFCPGGKGWSELPLASV